MKDRRVFLGIILILGTLVSQFTGGRVPDNPSIISLLVLILGLVGGSLAIVGKSNKWVIRLTTAVLVLVVLMVAIPSGRWSFGRFYLFDMAALALIGVAFFVARRH